MDMNLVKQYAEFAVKIGVNPQPGQTLIIRAPIEGAFFARACAEAAYAAGAKEVVVHYSDEKLSRIKMEHTAVEVLEDVKPWLQRSYLDYVESEGGACMLSISARDPEIYKGLDMEKIDRANQAAMKAQEEWRSYTMSDKVQWSIVAIPSAAWAGKVFPGAAEEYTPARRCLGFWSHMPRNWRRKTIIGFAKCRILFGYGRRIDRANGKY